MDRPMTTPQVACPHCNRVFGRACEVANHRKACPSLHPVRCSHPDGCEMSQKHLVRIDGRRWCFAHADRIRRNGNPGPPFRLYGTTDPIAIEYRKQSRPPKQSDADRKKKARIQKMQKKYGIDETQFEDLLKAQRNKCGNRYCDAFNPGGRWDTWHIDHDHETGQVRGLLCHDCNITLRRSMTPHRLIGLAEYLCRARTWIGFGPPSVDWLVLRLTEDR